MYSYSSRGTIAEFVERAKCQICKIEYMQVTYASNLYMHKKFNENQFQNIAMY